MPNRILRPGILTSERVNRLGPHAELLYRRLMSVVDDYGRYHAHPALVRAACYPLRVDEVREADISRYLAEVQAAGLLVLYAVNNTPYLEVQDTRWLKRSPSRFPEPCAEAVRSVRAACAQGNSLSLSLSLSLALAQAQQQQQSRRQKSPVVWTAPSWTPETGWNGITDDHKGRWKAAYPACDVDRQLLAMDAWLRANPDKAKKKRWLRFVVNWLSREQDRGGDQKYGSTGHGARGGTGQIGRATSGGFKASKSVDA